MLRTDAAAALQAVLPHAGLNNVDDVRALVPAFAKIPDGEVHQAAVDCGLSIGVSQLTLKANSDAYQAAIVAAAKA